MKREPYCTSFCNHAHDLADGKPIAHECYVLNPDALRAERDGRIDDVASGLIALFPRNRRDVHRGKRVRP